MIFWYYILLYPSGMGTIWALEPEFNEWGFSWRRHEERLTYQQIDSRSLGSHSQRPCSRALLPETSFAAFQPLWQLGKVHWLASMWTIGSTGLLLIGGGLPRPCTARVPFDAGLLRALSLRTLANHVILRLRQYWTARSTLLLKRERE